jgi:hypothetical protein
MQFDKACITGATSLLGREIAMRLARKNISLMLVGRDEQSLHAFAKSLDANVSIYAGDLTHEPFLNNLIQQIQHQVPDLIINNAGKGLYGSTTLHSIEEHDSILKLNCQALLAITLAATKALINAKKKGIVVNISSASSFFSFPYFNTYAATKAFVRYFSMALDREIKTQGVRILCACPGRIATDFAKKASKGLENLSTFGQMSIEKACDCVFKQIAKKKTLYIFDWRYRMLVACLKLLPSSFNNILLSLSIQRLFSESDES